MGEESIGLEVGSFSSGHVADPLGIVSKKNSWPNEKEAGAEGMFSSNSLLETPYFRSFPEFLYFIPHQGIATVASDENLSHDLLALASEKAGPS